MSPYVLEATTENDLGAVSQSNQWGPFNAGYEWFNTRKNLIIPNLETMEFNSYTGGCAFFRSQCPAANLPSLINLLMTPASPAINALLPGW